MPMLRKIATSIVNSESFAFNSNHVDLAQNSTVATGEDVPKSLRPHDGLPARSERKPIGSGLTAPALVTVSLN